MDNNRAVTFWSVILCFGYFTWFQSSDIRQADPIEAHVIAPLSLGDSPVAPTDQGQDDDGCRLLAGLGNPTPFQLVLREIWGVAIYRLPCPEEWIPRLHHRAERYSRLLRTIVVLFVSNQAP